MKSRVVETNQKGINPDLKNEVEKHQNHIWKKPIGAPTQKAWERFLRKFQYEGQNIILDSGVGVGESSLLLAYHNPSSIVIAHDRSVDRLQSMGVHRHHFEKENGVLTNLFVLRADSTDLWRLLLQTNWNFSKHYILYPNPYPKNIHIKKRWHGHPIFPDLVKLCPNIELRSNWKLYLEEFAEACKLVQGLHTTLTKMSEPEIVKTRFETKYFDSGQVLWKLTTKL